MFTISTVAQQCRDVHAGAIPDDREGSHLINTHPILPVPLTGTRILKCLTVLGLEAEAKAFFRCLSEIYEDEQNKPVPAVSDETMLYWREAVGDAGRSEQTG